MGVENIKIEPMKVYFGKDTVQKEKLIFSPALNRAGLSGKYFYLYCLALTGMIERHGFYFNDGEAVAATATLPTTNPIVLTKVATGPAENEKEFKTLVNPSAANPTDTVLAMFSGDTDVITLTITPNNGDNNSSTPVTLTTAEVVELINTGAVAGKNVTLTDADDLRELQTATGGGAESVATSGEMDFLTVEFDGGSSGIVAPNIQGTTFHAVNIVGASSLPAIVEATRAAVAAVTGRFTATTVGFNEVIVTHVNKGYAPAGHDALVEGKQSQIGIQLEVQGDEERHIGFIQGSIGVATRIATFQVKAQSEGATPIAELKTGVEDMGVQMELLESVKAQLRRIMVKANGSYIPDGGTELFGMGSYKNGANLFNFAGPLRLHPKRLLEGDRSEDWNWPKAFPLLDNVDLNGEEAMVLPVNFKAWPDDKLNERINLFFVGDAQQLNP